MGFAVNLLPDPGPERAWIEMVLDLDPASFEPHHVRMLQQGTADYLGADPAEVRVLGIARWKPIIQLELLASGAERIVRAFETRDAAWRRALRPLTLESVRLDSPSIPPPAETAAAPLRRAYQRGDPCRLEPRRPFSALDLARRYRAHLARRHGGGDRSARRSPGRGARRRLEP